VPAPAPAPAVIYAPAPASARTTTAAAPDRSVAPPSTVDHREEMTRLAIGYRGSYVPSSGFDPFSNRSYLPEFYAEASRTVFASGRLSFATGFAWDHGGSGSSARGDTTSLTLNRLAIPLEGRLHFGPWGYAFARVAPGLVALETQVEDESSPATLSKTQWLFATDLSAGYAWLVWPRYQREELVGRLWLEGDVGYGVVTQGQLNLGPDLGSGSVARVGGVNLGSIAMSGALFHVVAAVSF
jgi:hypothetical protein